MKSTTKETHRNSYHSSEDGTGITNFKPEQLELFEETIRLHGSDNYFIIMAPMLGNPQTVGTDYYSLHRHEPSDNSEFFRLFDVLRESKKKQEVQMCRFWMVGWTRLGVQGHHSLTIRGMRYTKCTKAQYRAGLARERYTRKNSIAP